MGVLVDLFGWPNGSVLTNLIASLLWAVPTGLLAVWRARVHLERLHRRHDRHEVQIDVLHTKLNALIRAQNGPGGDGG